MPHPVTQLIANMESYSSCKLTFNECSNDICILVLNNSYKLNFIANSNVSADAKPPHTNFQRRWIGFGAQDHAPSGSPKTNVKI